MYVRAGRPAFARPCVGIHKSTSLMSSCRTLLEKQRYIYIYIYIYWTLYIYIYIYWTLYIYIYIYIYWTIYIYIYFGRYIYIYILDTIHIYIYIYIYIYILDANKTDGEEARRQLHKNVTSNIEHVLAATPPQSTNYTATYLPSQVVFKLDEPDTQDTAGEAEMNS